MQLELARRRTALGELGREQLVAQVKIHVELGRLKRKIYFFLFLFILFWQRTTCVFVGGQVQIIL